MKYLVIGHRFGLLKRGGFVVSKRFCQEHSNYCEFKEDKRARRLELLDKQYKRIILRTQVPRCYSIPINFVKLRSINHIIYLRARYLSPFFNSCTNGFYYYQKHVKIQHYIPMITDFPKIENQPDEICLGFYVRKWLTPDSFERFIGILDELKYSHNVCIMGDPNDEIENHPKVKNFKHTNSNKEFFKTITHYFYPTSSYFVDPFPHSVLEATQSGKQIIFPKIKRDHKDGIDDIKDCIKWHDKFEPNKILDNRDQPLTSSNFRNYYHRIFDNNWEHIFERSKYKTMLDWVEGEVL